MLQPRRQELGLPHWPELSPLARFHGNAGVSPRPARMGARHSNIHGRAATSRTGGMREEVGRARPWT